MSYEVTKHIKGRDYLYRVERRHDPKTGQAKQKWIYVGRVAGDEVIEGHHRSAGDPRAKIIAALLKLLERRDISHLTIDVIVRAAGVSRPTFYRYFSGRVEAIVAAVDSVIDEIEMSATLGSAAHSLDAERASFKNWIGETVGTALRRPGVHRAIAASPALAQAQIARKQRRIERVVGMLGDYLAGLERDYALPLGDTSALANAIFSAILGVFNRVVFDREENAASLVAGLVTFTDRAVFACDANASRPRAA